MFRFTVLCIVLVVVVCTRLLAAQDPLQFRVLSERSGLYLAAFRSGRTHAHAVHPSRGTRFWPSHPGPGILRLESVKFPGRYLMMEDRKGVMKLRVGHVTTENAPRADFRILLLDGPVVVALRDFRGCLLGFDVSGELVPDPCSLIESDPEVRLTFHPYHINH